MNQTLDIASRILASLVMARPTGNPQTQAADALDRAVDFLNEAKAMGIDITDTTITQTTGEGTVTKPMSFGAKRKS